MPWLAFAPLLGLLAEVPDPRRAQGQLYKLPHVLLFSILAIVTGCNSYRGVVTFIDVHRRRLNAAFGLKWRRAPAHTAVRYILQGLDPAAVEAVFRRHAALLQAARATPGPGSIALDGKTLRGSFDKFHDRAAAQVLSAFATDTALVLAHVDIAEKSNEIPAAQALLAELGVAGWRHRHARCTALPKKHFEVAAQANIALIVQVKDNQPTLHQQIAEISATTAPLGAAHSHDRGRNRDERRTVTVFDPADKLADTDWHPHIAAIIRVERTVFTRNAKTGLLHHSAETAFYVSNTPITADPRRRGHPRALEDREHVPLQPRCHLRRRPLAHPHQPRRLRPPAQFRLQHPQGQPHRHAQPGHATAPPSQASTTSSPCSLFHSVEQPWFGPV